MLQLVYTSAATIPFTDDDIDALCRHSASNNARDEITGVLITSAGHFLQCLEGPKAAVEDTFLRIMVDPRHKDLVLLSRRLVMRREFGEWGMAHCDGPAKHQRIVEQVAALIKCEPEAVRDAFAEHWPLIPVASGRASRGDRATP